MVARTPPKQRRVLVDPLNPALIKETLIKVDKCMERLQELQYTVTGGKKVIGGVSLSPRSTRGYLRTSLRCKQESLRVKSSAPRKSPVGKFPATSIGDWRRMSLPAMLVGETVGEILQATQFAREIVAAVAPAAAGKTRKIAAPEDPKTPMTQTRKQKPHPENTHLRSKRKKEKQNKLEAIRTEHNSPQLQRARSRINFKVSPPKKAVIEAENVQYMANRVSPRHRPWARKAVLFPNPLFLSADSSQQPKFSKTRSPVISRPKTGSTATPHKFLIKSPVKIKSPQKIKSPPRSRSPLVCLLSPARNLNMNKKSPKMSTASRLRRSFSPSRLANRLVSPLKSRKGVQKVDGLTSGLKQRPVTAPRRFSFGGFA